MLWFPGQSLSDKDKTTLTLLLVDTVVAANDELTEPMTSG